MEHIVRQAIDLTSRLVVQVTARQRCFLVVIIILVIVTVCPDASAANEQAPATHGKASAAGTAAGIMGTAGEVHLPDELPSAQIGGQRVAVP